MLGTLARLAAGQWCFTARLDGRLISVRWAAAGQMHLEYLDYDLDLSADEACDRLSSVRRDRTAEAWPVDVAFS
jgi:hypothetical protein